MLWDPNRTVWYQNLCNRTLSTAQDWYCCIDQYTFNTSEIIPETVIFNFRENTLQPLLSDWIGLMRPFELGKCFTTKGFGKVDAMDAILIMMNASFGYRFYIHSEKEFFVSFNPSGLPRIDIGLEERLPKERFILFTSF